MGNKALQMQKSKSSLVITHLDDSKLPKINATSNFPLSVAAASLSCLAAEHNQIHNQESLDSWRGKAVQTINDLYQQKTSCLKHEAHVNALIGQLRAIIDQDIPHHENGYPMSNQDARSTPAIAEASKE